VINNAGLIEKTGGAGTSEIASSGLTLVNTGTLDVASGTLSLGSNISQVAGNTLSAGTWNALSGATLQFPNGTNITTNKAHINLAGSGANITGLSGLSSNSGSLSLTNGANFTTSGDFSNSGSLTLGTGGTLSVMGNFNQTSAGTLNIDIGGTPASGRFGQVAVQKAANLAGNFNVGLVNGFTPSIGQDFKVMTFASVSGTFNNVSGVSPDFVGHFNPASLDLVAGNAVGGAPVITGDPSNQTVTAGQSVSFTASASGNPTPTVQWQVSSNGGATFSNISGATSTTLTLNNVTPSMSGYAYHAVFTNSAGSAATSAATLTVQSASGEAPVITSGASAVFTAGQGGSFTVTATGSPTPTLVESGALPNGVTFTNNGNGTATIHGTPVPGTFGPYHFTVSAQNSAGSVTQSFTLMVKPLILNVPPLLWLFDSFLGGTETVNSDGTETITDSFFGIPLFVSTYNSAGDLMSVTLFGINITFLFGSPSYGGDFLGW
jgi:hypothetical protein